MSRHSNLYRKLRRDSTDTAKNRQTPQRLCRLERTLQDSEGLVQGVASQALESRSTCRAATGHLHEQLAAHTNSSGA